MPAEPIYVQFSWEDPHNGELQQLLLTPPIAMGREPEYIFQQPGHQSISCLELQDKQVSRFHALITVVSNQLYVSDRSANGTFLNGKPVGRSAQNFSSRDTLRIGPYKINANLISETDLNATEINRDQTVFGQQSSPDKLADRKIFVWFLGIAILLLTALIPWFIIQNLLQEPSSPSDSDSSSQSSLPQATAEVALDSLVN